MHFKNFFTSNLIFKFIIWPVIFLMAQNDPCLAQQNSTYIFRHIDQPDGLLHSEVKTIVQDGKGFIWILSPNGLQRYDGSRFVDYRYDLNNPAGITDTRSADLYADKKNNCLWITNPDIQKFDLQKSRFTLYRIDSIWQKSNFKFDHYTDSANNPWLVGDFGILKYNTREKNITALSLCQHLLDPNKSKVSFIDTLNEKTWLINYYTGLSLFDKKTKKLYTHNYNPLHNPLLQVFDKKKLTAIMKDSRNNIWISTNEPVFYKYNPLSNKISTYSLANSKNAKISAPNQDVILNVKCFYEDNHNRVWIGTENAGLWCYRPEDDSFLKIINDEKNKEGLHYNYIIWCIFQDTEENIWLGTDKGINIFNPYRQFFQSVHHQEGNPSSLPKNEIDCFIQAANGDIIAGTWGGGITLFDSNWQFKKNIVYAKPFEYNLVWSFIQNDDGTIWAGCQHGYIHIYDPLTETVRPIRPPETNNKTIRCMAKDNAGNIWIGLHDGKIAEWNKKEKKFYAYKDTVNGPEQIFAPVLNIFFDSKQRCWVSTNTGFKQFDTKQRMFSAVYLPGENDPQSISANTIEGVEEYNDSMLVIGTEFGGLNFFYPATNKFSHVTMRDGLPSASIYAIKKDAANNFWFTTAYGLYKFNKGTKNFIRYSIEPGIINSAFKTTGFYTLQNGRWLTATSSEIISFDPQKEVSRLNKNGGIEITGFNVFDKPVPIDSLLYINEPVRLNYTQNFITIEFAFLNFSNLQQTEYNYKLSGVNNDWVNADTRNFASYTNLQPGSYVFSVKAGKGGTTAKTTSFAIIIAPPFWKTWWFISLIALCIILMAYQFVKWRIRNIRAVEAEKLKVQQLNAERYKNKLELEQIVNYFSSSLIDKHNTDDVLWDVAKNLIGRLGFVDCMIYLWNSDRTKMIQQAGYGPKGSAEEIKKRYFDVSPGQGVVGYVMQTKHPVLIPDTSKDSRYRIDEMERLSEITVPVVYNDELIGVIDSEHPEKNFFTQQHVQVLSTIATLMANKIKAIESEQSLQETRIEVMGINEKLAEAKLEALRSQMNPHFIFNCLNSIDNFIQNDDKEKATKYLAKFAKLIRSILETSKKNVVPCWKDMETLTVYLELEALRLDQKFSYQVNVSDEILSGDYKVPPLVIQPFVENAIHHGLLNKTEPRKELLINVSVTQNYIHYVIQDNGVGRVKAAAYKQLNKPSHESMGLQITTERINLFNRNNNGSVKIIDLYDEQHHPVGTRVEVNLVNQ